MIIKGNPAGNVGFWSKHLLRDDKNERVEVKEISGLLADDLPTALREMQAIAAGSRSHGNFMYQANISPRADERLTEDQWKEAVDTLEKNLGLEGHQRVVVEHKKEGRTHRHVVWNRVDVEDLRVADMGGNWRIHTATARELENRFDLTPTPTPTPTPDRKSALELWEVRAAERSGLDPDGIKAELTQLWRMADNGKAFAAAVDERGYILAKGDRRDFCIVDHAGDAHSLARRLDGVPAKDVRDKLADIDRDSLPSVAEARATQREKHTEKQPAPQLGKAAGEIRLSWNTTKSAEAFAAALDERGAILARVSPVEAEDSHRLHAFTKAVGNYSPRYSEGEFVVVNKFGNVQRLNQRTTGQSRDEIDKRLATLDPAALPTMDAAQTTQQERHDRIEALKKLRAADRADNATRRADENKTFWDGVYAQREKRAAEAQKQGIRDAQAERARITDGGLSNKKTPSKLSVANAATGAVESLVDFVAGLLGGASKPPPDPATLDAMAEIRAQRRALAALENLRESMERGERLSPSDVQNLTPTHLQNIYARGDDYLREIIESMEKRRERERDWGRERER